MAKLHYNFVVKGKVQGVWFRKYTKDFAQSIGVVGFVKNLENGDVYVEAEGDYAQLNGLENWLYKGSPNSKVSTVHKVPGMLVYFKEFKISH